MPIWPVVRRSRLDDATPPSVRQGRSARKIRLPIAIALLGLLTATGCRGDQSRQSGMSPLRPFPWFTKADDAPRDDFSLKPIPRGDAATAPLPPPPSRSFSPPAAPAPEAPGPAAAGEYYGVRPTAAEEAQAANPSWSHRFRNLFRSESEQATTEPVIDQADAAPLLQPVPSS